EPRGSLQHSSAEMLYFLDYVPRPGYPFRTPRSVVVGKENLEAVRACSPAQLVHVGKFPKCIVGGRIATTPEPPSLRQADFGEDEWKMIALVPIVEGFAIVRIGDH